MTAAVSSRADDRVAENALDIVRIAGRIGAEIRGVKLWEYLDGSTIAAIRAALVRHKVIFFRGQTSLDGAAQEAFAERLGSPIKHPAMPAGTDLRYALDLDWANAWETQFSASWHTDTTYLPNYPEAAILRSVVHPEFGGDTLWANTVTAYEELPTPLKALVDGLKAIHTNADDYANAPTFMEAPVAQRERRRAAFASTIYETEHPVVRVHPESGERGLLLGHFVRNFVGLSSADSQRLYAILNDHITRPENTVRWRWNVGDVAIWDNRATQHRVIADFGDQRRHGRRVALAGSVTIGIDGKPSRLLNSIPRSSAPK